MLRHGPKAYLPLAINTALLAALVALAILQYQWIARLSEAERERMQAGLDSAATRFCDGFDLELTRASRILQPGDGLEEGDLAADLSSRLARWRQAAPEPGLVRELLVVTRLGRGEVELRRLDEPARRLEPAEWTPELDSVRGIFRARGRVPLLDERLPGLILPVRNPPPLPGAEPGDRRPPRFHVVVRLDRDFVTKKLLPRLSGREFGGRDGVPYAVTVAVAAGPGPLVFRDGPALAEGASPEKPDAARRLFALRPFPELSDLPALQRPPRPQRDERPREEPREQASRPEQGPPGEREAPAGPEVGRWLLAVRHPSGSLEAAVSGARRRNLGISLAVLLLLGTSAALLVASTRRAQALARQQMDFVAAVSHELKTPLTAMRSAGQNLADGIVSDPAKVRKYGALVEREGRRLTEMVGRVLAFAGLRSGAQAYRAEPVPVRPLVEAVLADSRWVLEEKQVRIETDLDDSLPAIRGDEQALRQALTNLVDNALKYGGPARWIGVRASLSTGPAGQEVVLSVSDRGPGIRRGDLSRLFEPFFRSAEASAAGIGGSGLGLAVVRGIAEGHGGRITVDSTPGKGSTFALHLPAVPAAAPRAPGAGQEATP